MSVDTATKAQLKKAGYRSKRVLPSSLKLSLNDYQYIIRVKVCVLLFKIYNITRQTSNERSTETDLHLAKIILQLLWLDQLVSKIELPSTLLTIDHDIVTPFHLHYAHYN